MKGIRRLFGANLASRLMWRDAAGDVRDEMRLHIELRTSELEADGLSPREARLRAEREVGRLEDVAPLAAGLAVRGDRSASWRLRVDELRTDLMHAFRRFRATPGFTVTAVCTIALGLGGNAAIFALVNTLFFRPLPFDPEGNLVRVREFRQNADGSRIEGDASRRTADMVASRRDLFLATVPVIGTQRAVLLADGPRHVQGTRVGPGFTSVAGVVPMLGRGFTTEEERTAAPVVLISHRLWASVFAGSPSAIGQDIRLEDGSMRIVGVLPPAFHVPYASDLWFPSRIGEQERSVFILARVAPGVTTHQLATELGQEGRRLNAAYPDVMRGMGVMSVRARDYFVQNDDRVAIVLMGAVGFLLLIGCANVALLLTTRFAARDREVAVRAALGCGRLRQIRQFVTEALVLFAIGGGLGLIFAMWLKDSLVVFLPRAVAHDIGLQGVPLDAAVVGFAGVAAVVFGLAFGLVAALRSTRADLTGVLRESGRTVAGMRNRGTLRALAAAEVALALALLTSAGLLADTFRRVQQRDLGFDPSGLLTLQAGTEAARFADGAARLDYVARLLERVRAMPAVTAAAITTVNPLCCGNWGARAAVEGHAVSATEQTPAFQHQLVTDSYFETMRIPILRGRSFSPDDRAGREMVAIVDDRAARRFWPGQDPIGKRVKLGAVGSPGPWMTVIGVAGTIEDAGEYPETWYLPLAQHPTGPSSRSLHLMVRSADPLLLVPPIKATSAEIDPLLALHEIRTMDRVRDDELKQNRVGVVVTALFAGAGVLLAALGLYGVLSFVLASDTRELAVRLALGASRGSVARLVVSRGVRATAWGLTGGVVLALASARGVERVLPEARLAPTILAASTLVVLLAALAATALPALRAMRVDPLESLRTE